MMQEWLLEQFEEGNITRTELRKALADRNFARDLWVEFCDRDQFIDECRGEIERFLEMVDEC